MGLLTEADCGGLGAGDLEGEREGGKEKGKEGGRDQGTKRGREGERGMKIGRDGGGWWNMPTAGSWLVCNTTGCGLL